jgi:hypothetical protein
MSSSEQNQADEQVTTALWKKVGWFGFLASITVRIGMTSEKVGPDVLKLVGSDPYAITLFGIPLLAGVLIAVSIIGHVHAVATKSRQRRLARIPPIVDGLAGSRLLSPVSAAVLIAFVWVPWFALGLATVKFFHGSYYYAPNADAGCDGKNMSGSCDKMGAGWKHFVPKYGVGSLRQTHYRYEANKTYIPVLCPLLLLSLSIVSSISCAWFFKSLTR